MGVQTTSACAIDPYASTAAFYFSPGINEVRSSLKGRQKQIDDELSCPGAQGKLRELAELIQSLTGQTIETKEEEEAESQPQAQ